MECDSRLISPLRLSDEGAATSFYTAPVSDRSASRTAPIRLVGAFRAAPKQRPTGPQPETWPMDVNDIEGNSLSCERAANGRRRRRRTTNERGRRRTMATTDAKTTSRRQMTDRNHRRRQRKMESDARPQGMSSHNGWRPTDDRWGGRMMGDGGWRTKNTDARQKNDDTRRRRMGTTTDTAGVARRRTTTVKVRRRRRHEGRGRTRGGGRGQGRG